MGDGVPPGKGHREAEELGPARGTGTTIQFEPDPQIFPRTEFNPDTIRERLETASYIHQGPEGHLERRRQWP